MRVTLTVLVAVCLASLGASAYCQGLGTSIWEQPAGESTPSASFLGSTGVVLIPSAQVGPVRSAQIYGHWANTNYKIGNETKDFWAYGADVMLTANLEVGALRIQNIPVEQAGGTGYFEDQTVANAKYRLSMARWTGNPEAPEVAIGVRDITDQYNRTYYVVATEPVTLKETEGVSKFNLTAGFGNTEQGTGVLDGFFAGIEFVPRPEVKLQADYDAHNLNACVRYYPIPNISLDVATLDGDLSLGATYRSGF